MEKFLEVICTNQLCVDEVGNKYEDFFEPFKSKLKEILSENLYQELDELFVECMVYTTSFYTTKGMEWAVGILNGTFTPKI